MVSLLQLGVVLLCPLLPFPQFFEDGPVALLDSDLKALPRWRKMKAVKAFNTYETQKRRCIGKCGAAISSRTKGSQK